MERLAVAAVLVVVAAAVAAVLRRRRPAPPTQSRYAVPTQLDRHDFADPPRPWLVVVFTSATCDSCRDAVAKAKVLASPAVAYQEAAWQDRKDLHDRYAVEVVPLTLMVDADGVVQASFIGATTATDLWAALAAARDGTSPPC
ncbi:MAG: hypothetical protein ACRD1K_06530 [Acidimicrobiales bacterium]